MGDLPLDVDFRVMLTFLEFYEAQMKFTMYRLYQGMGMRYPPAVNQNLRDRGGYLSAVRAVVTAPRKQICHANRRPDMELFAGFVFYLNREVPQKSLEFVILAFGGAVGSADVGSFSRDDPEI